jgi:hypothetical protein
MKMAGEIALTIQERLQPHGFGDTSPQLARQAGLAKLLHKPRGKGPRLFCGVALLQEPRTADEALAARQQVRRSLAKEHKGLIPWPGRMGTFLVLITPQRIFEELRGRIGAFLDTHGRHVNVLLGAVLVCRETLQTVSDNVLGLLGTPREFAIVQSAVEDWCRAERRRRGRYVSAAAALSVA